VKGLRIHPHDDSETLRLEFDNELYVQDFIKTQFAPIDVHVQVSQLLHLLNPYFADFKVEDEGEYFETGDLPLLARHRGTVQEVLNDYLSQSGKFHGPVRLDRGRIMDVFGGDGPSEET
jgi:hypothetical protein